MKTIELAAALALSSVFRQEDISSRADMPWNINHSFKKRYTKTKINKLARKLKRKQADKSKRINRGK